MSQKSWHLNAPSHHVTLVSSQVLVTALLRYQLEKITLGITIQWTLYTDERPRIMPQRSGGLENSKFFIQREQRSSTQ